ncbi:FkbM family methyltransferase [Dechloromonas sp. HYN0024]|uniref:FkbM family methyltransferase n=1 Tax=Dechloromonas sp. HYN0024 TaxID=2231055 RepID=UPI000E43B6C4|nr:FkbM family methyltransferase [Dechloromonas sp. HYN0024]AXS80366.1 FkbM family methyltransferase [Dechloromonas sp. HYN0024]
MEFLDKIYAALNAGPPSLSLADEFLSPSCTAPRYVIGRNDDAREVLRLTKVDGVIDDFANGILAWEGIPVVGLKAVPVNAIVLNCSTSISPVAVMSVLENAGITKLVNFCDLVSAAGGALELPWFVRQQRDDLSAHEAEWVKLWTLMADDESRQTLLDVVRYRLTAEPSFMYEYTVRLRDQYFESFMQLKDEVFVDAGGFDGDTSEEFCLRVPAYKAIYLFEPSPSNISAAKQRLAAQERIRFLQLGLSDSKGTLHFNSDAGSASSVSDVGDVMIEVVKLDDEVPERVSYIKMDLEGWEMRALAGCSRHIESDKPKLAISVYHAAEDFRRIPAYILSLQPNYQVYLRHYTQGWSETVMYFMPR